MGQRSQIFVRFEKNPGEKEIVARYYKWNCGDQMISIVYHTIEWLKKHLDLNNCGSGQYLLWNQKEFIRILGTKYDLGDVVIITDILNKYGDYWKDDNDGKALIDIQCDDAKKAELLEIYAKLVKTINGDDVVYLTNIQKFVDGHGATYISGTVAEPDLSDFEDDFHGNFSEFLTSCFKDRIDWYRISQNEELGKLPHGDVFGEKLELIV